MVVQDVIEAQELATLLPHSGAMCLLDSVRSWDERTISCRAVSHQDPNNPLRDRGILPAHAGIEYGGQAMAGHGGLCERRDTKPKLGYLAVLTNVDWYCSRLDDLPEALTVMAERLVAAGNGYSYHFGLYHLDTLLLEGQAVVALQDA